MLSTWDCNAYRKNEYIDTIWNFCNKITKEHFYHIGAKEVNRNAVMEALLTNYTPYEDCNQLIKFEEQLMLDLILELT